MEFILDSVPNHRDSVKELLWQVWESDTRYVSRNNIQHVSAELAQRKSILVCQRPKVNKVPGSQISANHYHHQHLFNFCGRNSICNQMHWCVWQSMVACHCRNKTNVNPIGIFSVHSIAPPSYILDNSEFSSQYSSFLYHKVSQEKRLMDIKK